MTSDLPMLGRLRSAPPRTGSRERSSAAGAEHRHSRPRCDSRSDQRDRPGADPRLTAASAKGGSTRSTASTPRGAAARDQAKTLLSREAWTRPVSALLTNRVSREACYVPLLRLVPLARTSSACPSSAAGIWRRAIGSVSPVSSRKSSGSGAADRGKRRCQPWGVAAATARLKSCI